MSEASADLQNWGQCNIQKQYRENGNVFLVRRGIRTLDWFLGEMVLELERASRGRFAPPFLLDRLTANVTFYYLSANATFGTKDSILSLAYIYSEIKYIDKSRKLKKPEKIDFKYT